MSGLSLRARHRGRGVDVDLDLPDGQVLAVLGPNGAGKSTLLALLAGLLRPDEGRVSLGARVLTDTATGVFVAPHARGVGLLAQQALLFPHLSVAANVAYGPRRAGRRRGEALATARHWLDAVGATDLADRRPAQLSGGQAQRVALARALAAEPEVLLLDEPLSALDVTAAPQMRRLLRTILRGRTAVIVTHDLLDVLAVADTVAVVEHGRIVERGPVREVLAAPRSAFAARMAGINLVSGTCSEPGVIRTPWGAEVGGSGEVPPGPAVAVFAPRAVSVRLDPPPLARNVIRTAVAELEISGATVHVRGAESPDGQPGVCADLDAAAVTDLDLTPGQEIYFVVDEAQVRLRAALTRN